MILYILLTFGLLSPTFGGFPSLTKKVTEESKKISDAAEFLNTASKEKAELMGISQKNAKQQIVEAMKIISAAELLNTASKEKAALLGISQENAKQQIVEAIFSKNGLDKEQKAFCPKDSKQVSKTSSSSTCSLQQFVPMHPAGFPHQKSKFPSSFDENTSPDCLGIIDNCVEKCPDCNKCDKFRTIDGKCNNLNLPESKTCRSNWGSRNQAFRRLTKNNYKDGISEPTGGKPQTGLPSARKVSNYIHAGSAPKDNQHTHLLMQLGQFIDHDISFTPEVDLDLKEDCCSDPSPSNCFPMQISPSDPNFKETCKDFARSAPKCDLGEVRQQFNAITAYLDGSQIYGSDETLQDHLRTKSGGLLNVSTEGGKDYLPTRQPCSAGYGGSSPLGTQFQAGDRRVTENPGLSGLHTIFLREHNRIAKKISSLKSWDDERIYQEARRIVIAELQNIIYREFLPIILGSDTVPHSEDSEYDPTEDASISNVFATAAYRFGHSLITGIVQMYPGSSGTYDLTEHFFNIDEIWDHGKLDNIMQGGARQDDETSDRFIHDSVRNELFKNIAKEGTDLAARNIQRGRDHGLGTFQTYKEKVCGDPSPPMWQSSDSAPELFSLYKGGYSQLEIFPGGLFEKIDPVVGGLVGPTFRCLIKKQFQSLKDGDRFFFTHKTDPSKCEYNCNRFTTSQQKHIMNRSLRDILCDNMDIEELQPLVLRKSGTGNMVQPCPPSNLNVASLLTADIC